MDREKTVELGNQVYGITPFDMNSNCESLNVAVATSIILYELDKQVEYERIIYW